MTKLYGIKNCDTVKKARTWLDQHQVDYQFHDFRADGLSETQVTQWLAELGLDTLINKRSTTWKDLDPALKSSLNAHSAVAVILANPTLIKRPLLETGALTKVGFSEADYRKIFA